MSATKSRRVPELSLSDFTSGSKEQKNNFVDSLFNGIKEYGFVNLSNHGIREPLLNSAYKEAKLLFDMPTKEKSAFVSSKGDGKRGYTPFGKEHAANSDIMDLKEFWHIGRDKYQKNIWPETLPNFRTVFAKLYEELDRVGLQLLQALAAPLDLPATYFSELADSGENTLRILHYPPVPDGVDPRCIRAAAHEDINLITLLVGATSGGLELKDRDGQWLAVETAPHLITVDTGDIMARLSNDVLPATTHRVVNPVGKNEARYSMPYFIHPKPEAILECIPSCVGDGAKYPPISSGQFLANRLKAIGFKA